MRVGIMQPYFFPYLGYFQLIHACDKFVFLDNVRFADNEFVHRNYLLINAERRAFGVEVAQKRGSTLIAELQLSDSPRWRQRLLKTIQQNYSRAPHYTAVMDSLVNPVILADTRSVSELNKSSVTHACSYLGLKTTIVESSSTYATGLQSGSERVRSICRMENASIYINSSGGKQLYSHDEFEADDIELKFLEPDIEAMKYSQGENKWTPYLSILDVLMWQSREVTRERMECYRLVKG